MFLRFVAVGASIVTLTSQSSQNLVFCSLQ